LNWLSGSRQKRGENKEMKWNQEHFTILELLLILLAVGALDMWSESRDDIYVWLNFGILFILFVEFSIRYNKQHKKKAN
jgi:hypothetical protein